MTLTAYTHTIEIREWAVIDKIILLIQQTQARRNVFEDFCWKEKRQAPFRLDLSENDAHTKKDDKLWLENNKSIFNSSIDERWAFLRFSSFFTSHTKRSTSLSVIHCNEQKNYLIAVTCVFLISLLNEKCGKKCFALN